MREQAPGRDNVATTEQQSQAGQEDRTGLGGLLQLQRLGGNGAMARLMVQREPYSEAGATQRAQEIDAQVRADPSMPLGQLERLMQERDRILPLAGNPPQTAATPPAGPPPPATGPGARIDPGSRWAPTPPDSMTGSIPLAMGVVMVPFGTGPPPVPPSILFPELIAAEGTAVAATEVGAGVVATEVGAGVVAAEVGAGVGTAGAVAGSSSLVPVIGWVVAGVIVVGIVGYLVYRHYSTTVPAPGRPERVEAPGAGGTEPRLLPGAPGSGPMSLPGAGPTDPVSLPGAPAPGPMSLPGAPRPPGPVLASSLPTHRTDFPTRDAARTRAEQLARTIVNGQLEMIEESDIYGTPQEAGHVTYYRVRGSTAEMRGTEPRGNIVCIVEHTSDPSQPPHFHVVRPPITGPRIEHGGVYHEPFAGTPDQHLTINPAGVTTSGSR
jgi:hypothetical protein